MSDVIDEAGEDVSLYRPDGAKLADNKADFFVLSIDNIINIDETLGTTDSPLFWTGSLSTGAGVAEFELGGTGVNSVVGRPDVNSGGQHIFAGVREDSELLPLLAISPVLTVGSSSAVPEPNSFVLLSLSIAGFGLLHRRRKLKKLEEVES